LPFEGFIFFFEKFLKYVDKNKKNGNISFGMNSELLKTAFSLLMTGKQNGRNEGKLHFFKGGIVTRPYKS